MLRKTLLILSVVLLGACSSQETLLRDITERDANEIVAVLYAHSINSQKTSDAKGKSFSVTVSKTELAKSVAILRSVGLPRESRPSLNDVFKSSGFAPTPFEERIRFIYGVSQELERTISYMPGVLNARVHVVIPEKSRRKETQGVASASVFVSYDEKVNFELEVPKVRKLVAESIEGLDESRIEVLTTPERVDLARLTGTPVNKVLGVRVHEEDSWVLSLVVAAFLAVIALALYQFRARLTAEYKKFSAMFGKK